MTEYIGKNGVVKYWDSDRFPVLNSAKKVMFLLSGGLDSCLSFYMLLAENEKLNLNLEIEILTTYETFRPYKTDVEMPTLLVAKFKEMFPNANIISHVFPEAVEKNTKNLIMRPIMEKRFLDETIDLVVDGVTANPPVDVMVELNMNEYGNSKRIFGEMHTEKGMYYHPFALVDKKFIVEMYKQLNIEELIPMTWSCVSNDTDPDNPVPCGICWWCKERDWAFGLK